MKATQVWRVMTPIKDRAPAVRYFPTLIVAVFRSDAIRVANQIAGQYGFVFERDVEVDQVARAISEDGA